MIGDNEIDSLGDGNKLWKLNVLNPQTSWESNNWRYWSWFGWDKLLMVTSIPLYETHVAKGKY